MENLEQPQKIGFKERLMQAANSRYGYWILCLVSFCESIFFPIPPDFLMIPMVVSKPRNWKKLALGVTLASVIGAFIGYLIGSVFFDTAGQWIINTYSLHEEVLKVQEFYNNNAFWSIILAGFTPIPYKVFTITSGMFNVNLAVFFIASFIGRGGRFFLVAYIAQVGGNEAFWNYLRKLKITTWIAITVLVTILSYWFLMR